MKTWYLKLKVYLYISPMFPVSREQLTTKNNANSNIQCIFGICLFLKWLMQNTKYCNIFIKNDYSCGYFDQYSMTLTKFHMSHLTFDTSWFNETDKMLLNKTLNIVYIKYQSMINSKNCRFKRKNGQQIIL